MADILSDENNFNPFYTKKRELASMNLQQCPNNARQLILWRNHPRSTEFHEQTRRAPAARQFAFDRQRVILSAGALCKLIIVNCSKEWDTKP
jgi:hypothetical protein